MYSRAKSETRDEFDLGKLAPIHFSISFAPITAPPTPNAINHQVSMAMASKIAKTLTAVIPKPIQVLALALLLD